MPRRRKNNYIPTVLVIFIIGSLIKNSDPQAFPIFLFIVGIIAVIYLIKVFYRIFILPIIKDINTVLEEQRIERRQKYLQNLELERREKEIQKHNTLIQKHKSTLVKKYKQLTYTDDYGCFKNESFLKELDYFVKNVLFEKQKPSNEEYLYEYNRLLIIIENAADEEFFIESVDNPYDFEKQCADILNNNGWQAKATQKSADQGIDVIATKEGITVALQCKLYSRPVGNKAVQEAYTGKQFYKADYVGVVSNSTFTPSARRLAKNCDVLLLSPDDLPNLDNLI